MVRLQRFLGAGNLPKAAWGLVLYGTQAKNSFYIFKKFFLKNETNEINNHQRKRYQRDFFVA